MEMLTGIVESVSAKRGRFTVVTQDNSIVYLMASESRNPQFVLNGTMPVVELSGMTCMSQVDGKWVNMFHRVSMANPGDEVVFTRYGEKLIWADKSVFDAFAAAAEQMGLTRSDWTGDLISISAGGLGRSSVMFPAPAMDMGYQMSAHRVRSLSSMAFFKERAIVGYGTAVKFSDGRFQLRQFSPRYPDKLFGVIPEDAPEGFWYYDGSNWIQPEPVLVLVDDEGATSRTVIGLATSVGGLIMDPRWADFSPRPVEAAHLGEEVPVMNAVVVDYYCQAFTSLR